MAKKRKKKKAKKKRKKTKKRSRPKKRKKKAKKKRKKAKKRKRPKKKKKKAKKKKKRKGARRKSAFMAPVKPSPALAAVIGAKSVPRTQVVKKLWLYIKRHKLQDKKNRRNINADAKLKVVFGGRKQVNMFKMTKLVSKHLK